MDLSYLESFLDSKTAQSLRSFVQQRFYFYRSKKYGNPQYWKAAEEERTIGYEGQWSAFIEAMLDKYIHPGNKVLFVGTANGSEIPDNCKYEFYALEQLQSSTNQLESSEKRIAKIITGNFEDENLLVDHPQSISGIIALRCLTPNCRLDRFSRFVRNNLALDGIIIISYPTSFLDISGALAPLENIDEQLQTFDQKIHAVFAQEQGMKLIDCFHTNVEKFYVLSLP